MARLGLLTGVLAFALTAAASIGSAQERVPVPGGVYEGTLTDVSGACSGGGPTPTLTITISDYGNRIESFALTTVYPLPTPSSSFSLYSHVPVAADGSFSQGGTLQLDGRFAGTGVSGSFRYDEGGILGCAGAFTAQLQPGQRVQQTFEGQVPLIDGCGGGTYSITRSAGRLSIVHLSVDGFHAGDQLFSGSGTFPEGTVPIDPETGSFDWVYFPGRVSGQEIAVSGSFASVGLLGLDLTVSPSTCPVVGFAFPALGSGPPGGRGGGLPGSGSGPSRQGGGLPSWWLLLGVSGVVAAGAAFAAHRRAATRSRR